MERHSEVAERVLENISRERRCRQRERAQTRLPGSGQCPALRLVVCLPRSGTLRRRVVRRIRGRGWGRGRACERYEGRMVHYRFTAPVHRGIVWWI